MRDKNLVDTQWLAAHLNDQDLRIVDMRGYVRTQNFEDGKQTAEYTGAKNEYEAEHIPGAVYLDWTKDIVDLNDPVPAQVASAEQLAQVLGEAGIGDNNLVVVYDAHPAMQFATRLWWVFRYYGHENVRVLDGGWKKWVAEGQPVNSFIPQFPAAAFTPKLQAQFRATAEEVLEMINKPGISLVDAREAGQYTGKLRRGKRAGHIPSAKHLSREELIDPNTGTFKSDTELKAVVDSAGLEPDKQIVAYCNGGVAATSVLFALSILDYPSLTNYDGSWNEWTEREDLPVE